MEIEDIKCKSGDIVKMIWRDVGAYNDYYPIEKIKDLIYEIREDFAVVSYGEVLYLKDNEIALAYSRNDSEARVIYMRTELIEYIEILVPCSPEQ